ncbi:protein MCM10 homolog [Euwallacea fornicatus]|uniref:protein MCM10 homolog n=1 Tax=Euwallacea fornicatus TaxID=995702 RepID=UPI00338E89D3
MTEQNDLLNALVAAITHQSEDTIPNSKTTTLKETDLFQFESNLKLPLKTTPNKKNSAVHSGDTDSSDDEGNRNYEDQKYNECGKEIKHILSSIEANSISRSHYGAPKQRISTWTSSTQPKTHKPKPVPESVKDVYMDPVFGMRIINPKIPLSLLGEKMQNRLAIPFSSLERQISLGNLKEKDWVICGVIVSKSPPKTSQKGTQYSIWTLSDLKDDIKTVGLFLFGGAHSDLWKTLVGSVVGVLNPSQMERREGSKDIAALSVDTAQRVMILGDSKDFGTCKSTKKNGEKCTAIVNLSRCEFCIYHIKQEYQKCSKRSELQANFVGKGLINLRNKVLGKNEVFYAGKSYMAIPAKKNHKLEAKESSIMQRLSLNGGLASVTVKGTNRKKQKGAARMLDVNPAERAKDLELLKKLGGSLENKTEFSGIQSSKVTTDSSKAIALDVISKLKTKSKNTAPATNTKVKYNLKGDLFTNIESKNRFSGQVSETITLDESKATALSVITKLKASNISQTVTQPESENSGFISLEEFETELSYTDEEDLAVSNIKTIPQNKLKSNKIDEITSKKLVPSTLIKSPSVNSSKSCETNERAEISKKNPLVKSPSALDNLCMGIPTLSCVGKGGLIDLNQPVTSRHVNRAKLNAVKYIQRHGPIKKADPNSTKSSKKRPLENFTETAVNAAKKSKLQESEFISDRFKKMMAMTSINAHLLEAHDNVEKEKYFNKLEIKERMEEKMVHTHKVKCKAVKCLKCKYVNFSASNMCKSEGHQLKVFDAMKRFYKCGYCQNRIATLEFIPTRPCGNCGSSKWEKTGMMKEKVAVMQHNLSIRGGEQKFVNSAVSDANLDLLVPNDS